MIRVVAGLIRHESLWLVAQRPLTKRMGGFWEFPGGKIEVGESAAQALVREIQEELGLTVRPERTLGEFPFEYDFGQVLLVGVLAAAKSREIELKEHLDAKWCTIAEIQRLKLAPADVPILKKLDLIE